MANDKPNNDETRRDRYRDNDDQRNPMDPRDRVAADADSKGEALGDAREAIGNTAHGTDAAPTGSEGNDRTRGKETVRDSFDDDLERDNRR